MLIDAPQGSLTNSAILPQMSLRERLREATDAVHQSLHQNAGLHALVGAQNSIALYRAVLTVFHDFYSALDNAFDFVAPPLRFACEAKPLDWLAQDFALHPQTGYTGHCPSPAEAFDQQSAAASLPRRIETYLGYLYVKQGSTLGGQSISKQLKKNLGLIPGETQFFFHGFGESTGLYWREFLAFLATHEQRVDNDLVVRAAVTYFELLDAAFKQHFPLEP